MLTKETLSGTFSSTAGQLRTETAARAACGEIKSIVCWLEGDEDMVNDLAVGATTNYVANGGPARWSYFASMTLGMGVKTGGTDSNDYLQFGWGDSRTTASDECGALASPIGTAILPTGSYSIFFVTSVEADGALLAGRDDSATNTDSFSIQSSGGQFRVYQAGTATLHCRYTAASITDNATRCWGIFYDADTQTQTLYLNGTQVDQRTSVPALAGTTTAHLEIGIGARADSQQRALQRSAQDFYLLGVFSQNLIHADNAAKLTIVNAYLDEKFASLGIVP